jgi:dihydrofolate reductase
MHKTQLIAIAAISANRAIGKDGKIPWYIPEDFAHFKSTTSGSPIIMGRRTFESIGRPLPGRENIVLSRSQFTHEWVTSFTDIDTLVEYLESKGEKKAFICWGSQIYDEFFRKWLTDTVILSRVRMDVDGADAFFSDFEDDFNLVDTDERALFVIEYWQRKETKMEDEA